MPIGQHATGFLIYCETLSNITGLVTIDYFIDPDKRTGCDLQTVAYKVRVLSEEI
jgi:hypothetical protein